MTDYYFFTWPDYVVLSIMLAVSAAIGIFYACTGGKQKTTKEYLLADGNMHWFPVACSLVASYTSTTSIIGIPAEVYIYGSGYMYAALGCGLGAIFALVFFLPLYEKLKIISIYQYIELRFGRPLKIVVVITSLISMMLYTALVIYGPAISIAAVTGLDIWISIFTISLISILYTTLGGLKAVLWTDAFQLVVMAGGLILVLIYGSHIHEGGLSEIWSSAKLSGRIDFIEPRVMDFDPRVRQTFWNSLLNGIVVFTNFYGCNQTSVQRYLSLRSKTHRNIAYILTFLGIWMFQTAGVIMGISIFGFFKMCDPLKAKEITLGDQLYPLYVMKLFGHLPGLPGLLLSAIFSASLSTFSSLLNSGSLIILEDFVKPCKPGLSDKRATVVSKIIALLLGLLSILLVVLIKFAGKGIVSATIVFAGMFGGPMLGLFIAAIYIPVTNTRGAFTGFIAGAVYGAVLASGGILYKPYQTKYPVTTAGCNITDSSQLANLTSPVFDPIVYDPHPHFRSGGLAFFDQSHNCVSVGGCLVSFLVTLIASILFNLKWRETVKESSLSPFLMNKCCLMPASWRASIIPFVQDTLTNSTNHDDDKLMTKPEVDGALREDNLETSTKC